MSEITPSYDRANAEESARVVWDEVRETESHLRRGREAANSLVEQLFGALSEKTQRALMHSLDEKGARFLSSHLFRNSVNNFYDFKNNREPLDNGFQIVFQVGESHFKNMSDIQDTVKELQDTWRGIVDVRAGASPENNLSVISLMLVRS